MSSAADFASVACLLPGGAAGGMLGEDAAGAGDVGGMGFFDDWLCHECVDVGTASSCARADSGGALIEILHLSHACCTPAGVEADGSLTGGDDFGLASGVGGLCFLAFEPAWLSLGLASVEDLVRFILVCYQCCLYLWCSSSWQPWWLLALAFAAGCHCRGVAVCRAISVAAACLLCVSDSVLGWHWHVFNIAAALRAPLFPPKRSRTGAHLKRENRKNLQKGVVAEAFAERGEVSQEAGFEHSICVDRCGCVFAFVVFGAGVGGGGGADASFGAGPAQPQRGASSSAIAAVPEQGCVEGASSSLSAAVPLSVKQPAAIDPLDDPDAAPMEEDSDVGLPDPLIL